MLKLEPGLFKANLSSLIMLRLILAMGAGRATSTGTTSARFSVRRCGDGKVEENCHGIGKQNTHSSKKTTINI